MARAKEAYFQALSEYADRLPRVPMSACPFTGEILKRSFDPYGLDGPWWHKDRVFAVSEPRAPAAFQVLLGALSLRGRTPTEVTQEVLPGPEVPFVVPELLELPGMLAVVNQVPLVNGDIAYPIAYFSEAAIDPRDLHQPWLCAEFWFEKEAGGKAWSISSAVWDFDLAPYLASGKLRWIRPGDPALRVMGARSPESCPYVNLPGERRPQVLVQGSRDFLDLPTGELINPFED